MDDPTSGDRTHIGPSNIALGLSFILFDALLSHVLKLGIGSSLITSSVRCVIQLSVMALVLQKVFETKNPWGVAGMAMLLNLAGTIEVVLNKANFRFSHMFLVVIISMVGSTMPVSIIGARFAITVQPFWTPDQFVPIVGMLCGNSISAVVIAVNYFLREIHDNRDKIETYLAFGASRLEACRPLVQEALKLALATPISQMSVLGIISIPGMMTGAILGGSSVEQAARLQMVIMFMIAAATALASVIVCVGMVGVVVDEEGRVRGDRVWGKGSGWGLGLGGLGKEDEDRKGKGKERTGLVERAWVGAKGVFGRGREKQGGEPVGGEEDREREPLLGSGSPGSSGSGSGSGSVGDTRNSNPNSNVGRRGDEQV